MSAPLLIEDYFYAEIKDIPIYGGITNCEDPWILEIMQVYKLKSFPLHTYNKLKANCLLGSNIHQLFF